MSQLIVVKVDHDPTVDAILGYSYHEWIEDGREALDSRGRRNPRMVQANWTKWICNNTECFALAFVSDQFVQTAIEREAAS